MTPKIFITGATGYIGGDFLHLLLTTHPAWTPTTTALVRTPSKGAKIASVYPSIRLVYGTLSSTTLLETEAAAADITLHLADADALPAIEALIRGVAKARDGKGGWLIHLSGTGVLCYEDLRRNRYGQPPEREYDDWENVADVTSLPVEAPHRRVEKAVLEASGSTGGKVKAAVVSPPTIHGVGRGPDNRASQQVPMAARGVLARGRGFRVGEGRNVWTAVNIVDLSSVFLLLTEAAVDGGGKATWGPEGYYFTGAERFEWGQVLQHLATLAHAKGLINSKEVESLSAEEAGEIHPYGAFLWGTNSPGKPVRAGEVLGWKPIAPGIAETVESALEVEVAKMGGKEGYGDKAAGK